MLLAEELALVAINPESGRHQIGTRDALNACLAGLLVAELLLDGTARPGKKSGTVELAGGPEPASPVLAAAAKVVFDKGPKIRAILSHMSRGLEHQLGAGTWDSAVGGLVAAGTLGETGGGMRPHNELLAPDAQQAVVSRLQSAAAGDGPIEPRTALVLSLTGPAQLLEVVAPDRKERRHARHRIDHALDDTDLEPIGDIVRKLMAEAAAMVAVAATGAVITSST